MNLKRLTLISLAAALMVVFTTAAFAQELTTKQWRVFNVNPSVPKLWDINKAGSAPTGLVGFTFPKLSSGWYAAYLNTNYGDLSQMSTITGVANWTASSYENRGSTPGSAFFRVYFQAAEGNPNSNDYWWSTVSCDLNASNGCFLFADLNNTATWSNLCGKPANDTNTYPGPNCIGGTDPNVSPADGFVNAKRNVKYVGLSFGGGNFFANGVANRLAPSAAFTLSSYKVQ
jgi:hypothetical protein